MTEKLYDLTTPLNRVSHFWYENAGFCGCANPEMVLDDVRKGLEALEKRRAAWHAPEPHDYEAIGKEFNSAFASDGHRLLLMYLFDHWGLTEHGGNVGGSWLDMPGEKLLADLRELGDDFDINLEYDVPEPVGGAKH